MSLKQVINELKKGGWKAALYFIQGHFNWWLHGKAIAKYVIKSKRCPTCFEKNECVHCGCPFNEMALSDKLCRNDYRWYLATPKEIEENTTDVIIDGKIEKPIKNKRSVTVINSTNVEIK